MSFPSTEHPIFNARTRGILVPEYKTRVHLFNIKGKAYKYTEQENIFPEYRTR